MSAPTGTRPTQTIQRNNAAGQAIFFDRKTRAYQKSPFNLILPYERNVGWCYSSGDPFNTVGTPAHFADTIAQAHLEPFVASNCATQSYEKLRGKLMDTAGIGVDFVEARQSIDMMTRSFGTLLKVARAVKSGRFYDAAVILDRHVIPKGVKLRRAWGNNFLEYHFGWEPLVKDVYDGLEVLHNPVKTWSATNAVAKDFRSGSWSDNLGSVTNGGKWTMEYVCKQGAIVRAITNAPLHTLEQLGVINPLELLWEVIPFSFVVDWFANVGNVLRSVTDFAGMTLERTYTSTIQRTYEQGTVKSNSGFYPYPTNGPRLYAAGGVYAKRILSLTQPVFSIKPLKLPSITRAVTASALLSQFLRS